MFRFAAIVCRREILVPAECLLLNLQRENQSRVHVCVKRVCDLSLTKVVKQATAAHANARAQVRLVMWLLLELWLLVC